MCSSGPSGIVGRDLPQYGAAHSMSLPQVYADFNAIERAADDHALVPLPLTGYGTLSSLATQGLRLSEGLEVLLYEPEDIECEAVVHFDSSRKGPAGHTGEWVALVLPSSIRKCAITQSPPQDFPCLICGALFDQKVRSYREVCSNCGASVMEPMAPPKSFAGSVHQVVPNASPERAREE